VLKGTIQEVRGSGWYSIQLQQSQDAPSIVRKFRASQIEPAVNGGVSNGSSNVSDISSSPYTTLTQTAENLAASLESEYSLPPPPPPTIIDLDATLDSCDQVERDHDSAYLHQVAHHLSFTKWVVFTDLHCAPSSLDTSLKVLDHVHRVAVEEDAGILFLGDWWHHRGTIRVDALNAVLKALSVWTQPLVMIPGNHDQVTLGGHNHGLTPLQHAFRCQNGTIPGPLIFSHPTIFGRALFVPHLRENSIMESVLRSSAAKKAQAIFCHADVTGASMNDLIVSQGGVLPRYFPARIPIYSGHFHKPHVVTISGVSIEYVGSPYETSLSEAHQEKQLLILDSSKGWECVKRQVLDLGLKHYRVDSLGELMNCSSDVRSGDRVVISILQDELLDMRRHSNKTGEICAFDATVAQLRKVGASVEIREVKAVPLRAIGPGDFDQDTRQLEELTPEATLTSYLSEEVNRETMSNISAQELLQEGMLLLDEMEVSAESSTGYILANIDFSFVSLEGFGPFKSPVTYPLINRGLVLLRGSNRDGGSDSNGSGKSSLAMATLWALTGSVDPRIVADGKASDIVTDGCKSAKVVVQGKLNGENFRITRTKTSSKTGLVFFLGNQDMTMQSVRETQDYIDEKFGANLQLLARTVFHGQHAVNGLLEATDIKFKEELSYIVPLELWQNAAILARTKARNASNAELEIRAMVKLRESDLKEFEARRDESLSRIKEKRATFDEKMELSKKGQLVSSESGIRLEDVTLTKSKLDDARREIEELAFELRQRKEYRKKEEERARKVCDERSRLVEDARGILVEAQRELDKAIIKVESAEAAVKSTELKWKTDLSSGDPVEVDFENCPTCLQPLSSFGVRHSHNDLKRVFEMEVQQVQNDLKHAFTTRSAAQQSFNQAVESLRAKEADLKVVLTDQEKIKSTWATKVANLEFLLEEAQTKQNKYSDRLADAMSIMKQVADIRAAKATLEAAEELWKAAQEVHAQCEADLLTAQKKLEHLKAEVEEQKNALATFSRLSEAFGAKGVQNYVLQNAIQALESIAQAYLDEMSDGSLRLSLTLDAGDKISRRAFVRLPDGDYAERPLSSLSGGQWRRCSIALSLGFVDLMSRRGRLRASLLVFDEPLTHLDRSGRNRIGAIFRKLLRENDCFGGMGGIGIRASTIILILQDLAAEELEEAFDHIDEVVKEKGFSSVIIDERSH
jgi:DNA repair exonuclease SbcCD ATPase subunit/DNA repair exonuclease SbcCD nuclease subunit